MTSLFRENQRRGMVGQMDRHMDRVQCLMWPPIVNIIILCD